MISEFSRQILKYAINKNSGFVGPSHEISPAVTNPYIAWRSEQRFSEEIAREADAIKTLLSTATPVGLGEFAGLATLGTDETIGRKHLHRMHVHVEERPSPTGNHVHRGVGLADIHMTQYHRRFGKI